MAPSYSAGIVNKNFMENTMHKAQINFTVRRDKDNNVIDKNVMVNVRTDDVDEAIQIYTDLRQRLNGQLDPNPTQTQLTEKCPNCGRNLVERKSKDGTAFLGCSGFRDGCCFTKTL
ncbi:topoisomerase DNA-binding C4 zinc finger domain-containing protein [Patescibacteria group bacterium]